MQELKVGDRVEYIAGNNWHLKKFLGRKATVEGPDNSGNLEFVRVVFDGDVRTGDWYRCNFRLIPKITVEEALAVLKEVGAVTFKPNKPAWKVIDIQLNKEYVANVYSNKVIVGCQQFAFKEIDALYAAVTKARKYSSE